jgi:hypothetical protein
LTKTAWKKSLVYKTDTVSIEIGPGPRGVATIYDKEVLLYIASLLAAKSDAGEPVSQDFYFTAHDLFRVTGVNSSSRSYTRLSDALERLQGTQIKTNIEAGGEGETGFFSWLSEARLQYTRPNPGISGSRPSGSVCVIGSTARSCATVRFWGIRRPISRSVPLSGVSTRSPARAARRGRSKWILRN